MNGRAYIVSTLQINENNSFLIFGDVNDGIH